MMSVATCTWLLRAVEYANLGPGQRVARFKKEKLVRVLYSGCNSYAPTVAMAEKTHGVENRRRFSPVFNPVCFQPKASARCVAAGLSKLCEPFQKLKATRRSLYKQDFAAKQYGTTRFGKFIGTITLAELVVERGTVLRTEPPTVVAQSVSILYDKHRSQAIPLSMAAAASLYPRERTIYQDRNITTRLLCGF